MPFSFTNKSAGDLIKSQDWNAAMAAIVALYDRLNATTGHRHTGSPEDGPQIANAGIADLAITFQKLADLAVTTPKIDNLAVNNQKLAAGAVDGTKLAAGAVGNSHIVAGAVDVTKMAANSVGNTQIANSSVTVGKMAANSVGSSQLIDLSVSVNKIVDGSVTTPKIGDGQVTAAKMAAGVIPQIGVLMSWWLTDNQVVAMPSGFLYEECIFFASPAYINKTYSAFPVQVYHDTWVYGNWNGSVYVPTLRTSIISGGTMQSHVLVLGKKGGW